MPWWGWLLIGAGGVAVLGLTGIAYLWYRAMKDWP